MKAHPSARLRWKESVRIVGAEHGTNEVLERVTDAEDLEVVLAFEALTSPSATDLLARLSNVEPARRFVGPGSSDAMAPFLYYAPPGGRFSDGSYGVYYAARDRATAISETRFHRERLLREAGAPSQVVALRVLLAALDVVVVDLRAETAAELSDPDPAHYGAAQAFGARSRADGANGVAYRSVRREGGECVALFHSRAVGAVRRAEQLHYEWSGTRREVVAVTQLLGR